MGDRGISEGDTCEAASDYTPGYRRISLGVDGASRRELTSIDGWTVPRAYHAPHLVDIAAAAKDRGRRHVVPNRATPDPPRNVSRLPLDGERRGGGTTGDGDDEGSAGWEGTGGGADGDSQGADNTATARPAEPARKVRRYRVWSTEVAVWQNHKVQKIW